MIKVKVSFPNDADYLRQLPKNNSIWENFHFCINDYSENQFDYWVIFGNIETPTIATYCDPSKTILVTTEPKNVHIYPKRFTDQFGIIITAQEEIDHPNKFLMPEGQLWFIESNFDTLINSKPFKKTESLSIILSNKVTTKEHFSRVEFAFELKKYFGANLHWYGSGFRPFKSKQDVLGPYRYSVVLESTSVPYYLSEKITDSFLCYTFPFYYGCKNIDNYYNPLSFQKIDIYNQYETFKNIETILKKEDTHYSDSLQYLEISRRKYLLDLQFFANLKAVINEIEKKQYGNVAKTEKVVIKRDYISLSSKIFNRLLVYKNPYSQIQLKSKLKKILSN